MADETPFRDPEEATREFVLDCFKDLEDFGAANVGNFPGPGLAEKLPYVSVDLVDGPADYFEASPIMAIDVFAGRKDLAKKLAWELQLYFMRYPQVVEVQGRAFVLDFAECLSIPHDVPWDDTKVRRQSARYQITSRR